MSRWYSPTDVRQTARLLSLAAASLRSNGVADPEKQICWHFPAVDDHRLQGTVFRRRPEKVAPGDLGARLHDPDLPRAARCRPAADGGSQGRHPDGDRAHRREQSSRFAAADNRPFFFNQVVFTDLVSLRKATLDLEGVGGGNLRAAKTIGIVVVLSLILVLSTMIAPSLRSCARFKPRLPGSEPSISS